MPVKKKSKAGKIDVRSKNDISDFEKLIVQGPLTVVLVYADWCGHCQTFKEKTWNKVSQLPNKTVNTASVHYDMLENTSLANSKIEGYPSLLMVEPNKKPVEFNESGTNTTTNAMPQESVDNLESIVTSKTPVDSIKTIPFNKTSTNNTSFNTNNIKSDNTSLNTNTAFCWESSLP